MTHRHHHQRRPDYAPLVRGFAGDFSLQVAQQLGKGSLRVGDQEREAAARALGEHYALGRLDREEYDERVDAAYAARTQGDLMVLFRDLPQRWPVRAQRPAPPARSGHGLPLPFWPVLLILIGVSIATGAGWLVWVGLGGMLLAKKVQHDRRRRQRRAGWA